MSITNADRLAIDELIYWRFARPKKDTQCLILYRDSGEPDRKAKVDRAEAFTRDFRSQLDEFAREISRGSGQKGQDEFVVELTKKLKAVSKEKKNTAPFRKKLCEVNESINDGLFTFSTTGLALIALAYDNTLRFPETKIAP